MSDLVKWAISFLVGAGLIALGWKVPFVLGTVYVLVCFLLIVVVLLQSGKAADLAGAFGGAGSQTAFGPRGAATFLSKATTWCAVMFMLIAMTLVLHQTQVGPSASSVLEKTKKTAPAPTTPTTNPAKNAAPGTTTAPGQTVNIPFPVDSKGNVTQPQPAKSGPTSAPAGQPSTPAKAPTSGDAQKAPAPQPPATKQPSPAKP